MENSPVHYVPSACLVLIGGGFADSGKESMAKELRASQQSVSREHIFDRSKKWRGAAVNRRKYTRTVSISSVISRMS
jgi:hypothetical protein